MMLYLIIAASGQFEQYHKTGIRSRPKSSGGAHASASAAAIFFIENRRKTPGFRHGERQLLSAVVSADLTPSITQPHSHERGCVI